MALNSVRKAALLLMALDPGAAAELLKSASVETVTAIAAELAYLDATGAGGQGAPAGPVQEFFALLERRSGGPGEGQFLRKVLQNVLGDQKSGEVLGRVEEMVRARDPFLPIRSAQVEGIAQAVAAEPPQVVSLVLSELPAQKSAALVGLLDEQVRTEAVCGMVGGKEILPEAKLKVATVIWARLQALSRGGEPVVDAGSARDEQMRKVAVLLRGLKSEMRGNLLGVVLERDREAGEAVQRLMVMWEDIPHVAERSLQEALRAVDSRMLALALVGVEEDIAAKVRANISERANAMLEEETSLLSSPKSEEIEEARGGIVDAMRELYANDMLEFEEE